LQIICKLFGINACGKILRQNILHHEIWPLEIAGKSGFLPDFPGALP
jgi:hypothetical protein